MSSQHTIAESIESILAQTFTDFEIIVVDDGSTDETVAVIERFPEVTLLQQTNSGPGEARNLAAKKAKGRYLAFLDSDDLWFPWTLATYNEVIAACGCQFGSSPSVILKTEDHAKHADELAYETFPSFLKANEIGDAFLGTPGLFVVRDCYNAVDGFIGKKLNGEDQDFCLRMGDVSSFVIIRSPFTFRVREHESQVSGDIRLSLDGVRVMIAKERIGGYPGGKAHNASRRKLIGAFARTTAVGLVNNRLFLPAIEIYFKTVGWHLAAKRFKFVLAFPFYAIRKLVA